MTNVPLTEERFLELIKSLNLVSQSDLDKLKKGLIVQIVESNKIIISTSEKLHDDMMKRLDDLELNTVKRSEFEALRRKVERYHTN